MGTLTEKQLAFTLRMHVWIVLQQNYTCTCVHVCFIVIQTTYVN